MDFTKEDIFYKSKQRKRNSKLQTPSSREYSNFNLQGSNRGPVSQQAPDQTICGWSLVLEVSLEFGVWWSVFS
jgi:hypothetical protein